MEKAKTLDLKKLAALITLIAGAAFLAYALIRGSTHSSIPDWKPVNEPLKTAIESLSATPAPTPMPMQFAAAKDSNETRSKIDGSTRGNESLLPDDPVSGRAPADTPNIGAEAVSSPIVAETPASRKSDPGLLDLNQATQAQLETLPGIGPSKAIAIIAYREQNNGFRSVEQLQEVKGIGPKVYERISVLVQIPSGK